MTSEEWFSSITTYRKLEASTKMPYYQFKLSLELNGKLSRWTTHAP